MNLAADRVQLLNDVIKRRLSQLQTANRIRPTLIREVLEQFLAQEARKLQINRTTSFRYNPFLTIPIGETTHSRLLGDLLNPKGTHGQGGLFLFKFLKRVGIANPTQGQWRISVELGRIDISLWRVDPQSIVVIENKSNWAIDQQEQLYRYWFEAIYLTNRCLDRCEKTTKHYKIVYISPSKNKTPSSYSLRRPKYLNHLKELPEKIPLTPIIFTLNDDLPSWLSECSTKIGAENNRLRVALEMYQEIWKR